MHSCRLTEFVTFKNYSLLLKASSAVHWPCPNVFWAQVTNIRNIHQNMSTMHLSLPCILITFNNGPGQSCGYTPFWSFCFDSNTPGLLVSQTGTLLRHCRGLVTHKKAYCKNGIVKVKPKQTQSTRLKSIWIKKQSKVSAPYMLDWPSNLDFGL